MTISQVNHSKQSSVLLLQIPMEGGMSLYYTAVCNTNTLREFKSMRSSPKPLLLDSERKGTNTARPMQIQVQRRGDTETQQENLTALDYN